jgi:hypothetical protein
VNFRNGFYAGLLVAAIWGIYLARLWQPRRQVELHSVHLLAQIETRNWKTVGKFIGAGYEDRWGNDRALLLERLPQILRVMPNARIESSEATVRPGNGRGVWSAKIKITSTGQFADVIQDRVNSLDSAFEFEWRRGATWPWDWKLISVRNPALEISDYAR